MPSRLQRELLNQAAFIARIGNIVRHLNQRIGASIVFDVNRCRLAHQKSRSELEIALDTANAHELFEAFDAFLRNPT
jgi:hypothetical protein